MLLSINPLLGIIFFGFLTFLLIILTVIAFSIERSGDRNLYNKLKYQWTIFFTICAYFSLTEFVFKYDKKYSKLYQPYEEKFSLLYLNDSIYCTGTNKVTIKISNKYLPTRRYFVHTKRRHEGCWKFYTSDGKVKREVWYDDRGIWNRIRDYWSNGSIQSEYLKTNKNGIIVSSSNTYHTNGIISTQNITEYSDNSKDEKILQNIISNYHPNGIKESTIITNDFGTHTTMWDTTGKIVLKLDGNPWQ